MVLVVGSGNCRDTAAHGNSVDAAIFPWERFIVYNTVRGLENHANGGSVLAAGRTLGEARGRRLARAINHTPPMRSIKECVMLESVRRQYEAFPDPSPTVVPIRPDQLDRIDDNLHFGWSWARYRYCFRRTPDLRVLDAGCGTGLSSLGLAQLNPGASVLGVDATPRALELAHERVAASGLSGVTFRAHDLEEPLPREWGPFDFIVCRRVLAQADDGARVLRNLAAALDARGLLYLTLPTRTGRAPARQMRQAVDALSPPGATLAQKVEVGRELFQTLRPDHPIRRYEEGYSGKSIPDASRFVVGYLSEAERDWSLPEAITLLESAGLKFLFAATRAPWRADRVLSNAAVPQSLQDHVNALDPGRLSLLIDALDPVLHADEYRIYGCLAEHEPHVPAWVEESQNDAGAFGRLIPHRTGLARPNGPSHEPRVRYRTVAGALGEVVRNSHLLVELIDDSRSCEQIDVLAAESTGAIETPEERRNRWLELANAGFVLLEAADPRQHVDCVHLGPIVDRLDCACPRRWLRACELHQYCTLAVVSSDDEKFGAVTDALAKRNVAQAAACASCADYVPEE